MTDAEKPVRRTSPELAATKHTFRNAGGKCPILTNCNFCNISQQNILNGE
jgi:hypothetical protein